MGARSTGFFPIKAAWVDTLTLLPSDGSDLTVPNLQHSGEVTYVAYFNATAAGSVDVKDGSDNVLVTLTAPTGGGKVFAVRSGYETGEITTVKLDSANLSAGAVQVSVF
ncbi:predicted protein [Cyanophage PSS2]|uniref:hypothetical protein n=1 Tax=Cyanophage PSS2 TaxID=658401 RepID=UPI0001B04034|nr:hypothetical protein PSS2_gp093 [Cyanophage PSS2]ACT65655.1 hypothetical protein [Cyanophage PSS2]ACY75796.1 predicted protein [Cyanophage PSS2]